MRQRWREQRVTSGGGNVPEDAPLSVQKTEKWEEEGGDEAAVKGEAVTEDWLVWVWGLEKGASHNGQAARLLECVGYGQSNTAGTAGLALNSGRRASVPRCGVKTDYLCPVCPMTRLPQCRPLVSSSIVRLADHCT
ncbi:hypothetical protein E2C01_073424 [Portunus trituberculatus]|uniref:Uncharacterized protein n=1 Tax=Portunus trituberculatus TaxID=210409 RepID=A0A5B7IBN3_PORTR|nr:hypothetical protein [Portunus trituberculatus]